MLNTRPLPCTVVMCVGEVGGGGNQGVARLVLTGCGIAVSEIWESFAKIRDDAFTFVSLRTKSYLIAPYR